MLEDSIFADSLLEMSWAQRTRRSWTTLTSFGLEIFGIAVLLLLPVLKTVGLPSARTVSTPITLGRRAPVPLVATPHGGTHYAAQNNMGARLLMPGRMPRRVDTTPDDPLSQPPGTTAGGPLGGGFTSGSPDGLSIPSIGGTSAILPTLRPTLVPVIRTSSMLEGNLIRRVQPVYPPLARTARVQGSVVLYALISKAGTMENLHVLSGPPLLVPAAIDAVSQWRYRPYILNSEPIEVETQVTVNFSLSGN
jgi:periplasmic protein TonB